VTPRLPILVGTGLTVGAAVLAASVVADRHKVSPSDAEILAEGRVIYEAECAACHGAELEGQPDWRSPLPSGRLPAPPHDASGHTWHHPDDVLFRIVMKGTAAIVGGGYESDMPGFADVLSDAEIRAVLAFIKSTWPERERRYQERASEANQPFP
jgi:mono/diheme cytochrome c family protein